MTEERPPAVKDAPGNRQGLDTAVLHQIWTIAKIELRRAFFSRRGFWVYGLALLPTLLFFGHAVEVKIRRDRLSRGRIEPALMDSARIGESFEEVRSRLGTPSNEDHWESRKRLRSKDTATGVTTHTIEPAEARYVRLNVIRPTFDRDRAARIYEFEIYGTDNAKNLALNRPATGSDPCSNDEGPEKAFNGSIFGGMDDKWCSDERDRFLQVDLESTQKIARFVISHASAGGEDEDLDTREFNIQISKDAKVFRTVVAVTSTGFVDERTSHRQLTYFDGSRWVQLRFENGTLKAKNNQPLANFDEDRSVFAGIFRFYYLRLAIFFGCLGIFMNLFRGEMLDKTLHFWLLAPIRREVLLAGKYGAGLVASAAIFGGGAMICFLIMMWPHDPAAIRAYWQGEGPAHLFWYATAAIFGCVGYGSAFLAAGLLLRNPIIPAAVLLLWEGSINFLPETLQKVSVLYYLQSLCPVPAPMDKDVPALIQLIFSPAAPASKPAAIAGLLAVTAVVLWLAGLAIRRIQISYGSES
jgi:ABC-type transport system involved in multi-copper enzyme maturation permease subunit